MNQFKSKLSNEDHKLACENPECGRKDRPLYIWFGEDGTDSALYCDICTVRSLPKQSQEIIEDTGRFDQNPDEYDDNEPELDMFGEPV